ncbi:MAG TPA: M23 family metallopeptidase [Dinghuibacter sp.]|uniref:M23 family metallopeptidase n=1 Tax=Dinghuibacter sp. TaxID=2024697 RepID=UPI002C4AB983|nr:M23 family metallopeptidase [Dinghuibacter sp.]HTJ12086.1 M23 family metallopeptidase [Dinghuibacter sp.]
MHYIVILLLLFTPGAPQDVPADLRGLCASFDSLNTAILDGTIPRATAAGRCKQLLAEIRAAAPAARDTLWTFPLKGYTYTAIGGTNGNGYADKGYRYLDGNRHLAHPAHDIFIRDKDQDQMDDRTGAPVDVLAVSDGIVIACRDHWDIHSSLRGGKYIWLYHPQTGLITYYAHNRAILVSPGDVVRRGQKIAEVGRTGFNAYPRRSPTHLHFSSFTTADGLPVPFNGFARLKNAQHV